MLTDNLRASEEDGLLESEMFAEVPPQVEYTLSESDKTLKSVLDALSNRRNDYKNNI